LVLMVVLVPRYPTDTESHAERLEQIR
jgi:hypothetical protein